MFRRHRIEVGLGLVVGLLLGLGCGSRTIGGGGGDNNNNNNVDPGPDSGVLVDAAIVPPDGGSGTCESDQYKLLRPWPVAELFVMQDLPISEGQTVRLAVGLYIGGCQRLAQVDYVVEPSQRTIYVTAWIWETTGPQVECPDMAMYVEEILTFTGLAAGEWRVAERTSGVPGVEITFEVDPCGANEDCFCSTVPPGGGGYGEPCDFNCECDFALECIVHWGFGGNYAICAHSCSVDADCRPQERCIFTDAGPYAVCEPMMGVDQCPVGGCEPGYECYQDAAGGSYCLASFDMSDDGTPCSCPADCPTGLTCVDFGGGAWPTCHVPCRGDRDCSGGMCGDTLPDTSPICYMMWM